MSPSFAVILPAGGSSSRFGADKLSLSLGGVPVLSRTVALFHRPDVRQVVVATTSATHRELLRGNDLTFVPGGRCRAESVRNALQAVDRSIEFVAVHDAARPLTPKAVIDRCFVEAARRGSAVPALPVKLTIKQADGPLPARVLRTPPRRSLWEMQTPQVMRRDRLVEAFERCPIPLEQVTDDAQLLELLGDPVWLVEGDERNLKLTTASDVVLAEHWLRNG